MKRRLVADNPFAELKSRVTGNQERFYFIDRETAEKVIAACPDAQWRLLFALSRFGGLRCPSEHLALRWGDIDWESNRIRVPSPKTEHHEGKAERWIPLFPELRPHLEECFDLAEPGAEFVITIARDGGKNFRTRFAKIIRRAGLTPWPRAFHNLRASRQTELASVYAAHVVCAWLGNTEAVAREHYLRVTEADFERAVREPTSALQNPVQYAHAQGRNATQLQKADNAKTPVLPGFATHCDAMPVDMIPPRGVEPFADSAGNSQGLQSGAAKSGAVGARNADLAAPETPPADPDLARLIAVWPTLPEAARLAVLKAAGIEPT
jgi:hypothetical protein